MALLSRTESLSTCDILSNVLVILRDNILTLRINLELFQYVQSVDPFKGKKQSGFDFLL